MKKKRVLSVLLALVMVFSMTATPAMAATKGKTVTFKGGQITKTDKGTSGSIEMKVSNITKTKSVNISEKKLLSYLDDAAMADKAIAYDSDTDEAITLKDCVTAGKVKVYYANSTPVTLTVKTPMSTFWMYYKGDEEKTKFAEKFFKLNEYLMDGLDAKVYTKMPEDKWLVAPGAALKITKPGKYLFITKDDGLVDGRPIGVFCVIVTD